MKAETTPAAAGSPADWEHTDESLAVSSTPAARTPAVAGTDAESVAGRRRLAENRLCRWPEHLWMLPSLSYKRRLP